MCYHYFAKFSKCKFGVQQVDYLGHIISDAGLQAIKNSLRAFLGLTGFYRQYASLASPVTDYSRNLNSYGQKQQVQIFIPLRQQW